MTLLEIIAKWGGFSAPNLIDALRAAAAAAPDVAPLLNQFIEKVTAATTQVNLIALASDVLNEAKDIGQGIIRPHDHPSDA